MTTWSWTDCAEYISIDGDRWDSIAWSCYGNPWLYEPIIHANPTVPIRPHIAAGTRLLIPVLDTTATIAAATRPPWKQG